MKHLADIRNDYTKGSLNRDDLDLNPFKQFNKWMKEAIDAQCNEPTAVTLATVDEVNMPNCRIVLLKDVCDDGFVFFTNYNSTKGQEMRHKANAALNFFWPELERQVRVRGTIEKVSSHKSDAYFQSRPRESQLGAWASNQSEPLESKAELLSNYSELEQKYQDKKIPRPDHWGGYIVKAYSIEFWQGRSNRMHDRFQYVQKAEKWEINQLAP
ncbi:pyridoxamine 5'-phosphate oxidase [Carboxylicivirga sp. A043]|uniref:pyridoxamine 5'-phosphate oxidase n=1 Tax=Carboxylicivirga litoralis TaxID=2816963 RepID=UPI0021CB7BA7|nr:pyridoxamine 5'-phosphate oxidase [Carboxylicivirga sp. A043]MCU4155272.1 pyridoxamine 5'-phosphate oxidase [Carboxylicivirga sp. A043]